MPGSSEIMDLADQIQRIGTNRRTGTLIVKGSMGKAKYIYFDGGRIQMVSIPRKKYLLGEALFKIGKIERNELLGIIKQSSEKKGVLGTLLLENKSITREDLVEAMSFQLQEEICDLFVWDSIDFDFEDGEPDHRLFPSELLKSKVSLNTEMLVLEAARRMDEWGRIKDIIPSLQDVYRRTGKTAEGDGLDEAGRLIYDNVNGMNDVEDILERTRLDRYAALHAFARVKENGFIEPLSGNELVSVAGEKDFSDPGRKLDLLGRATEVGMDIPEGFLELVSTYEELGQEEKAAEAYLHYARASRKEEDAENTCEGYRKAVEKNPDLLGAYEGLGEYLVSLDRKEEAAAVFIEAAEHLMQEDRLEESKKFWQQALETDGNNVQAVVGLGEYFEKEGDPTQAIVEFGKASDMLLEQNRKEEAVGLFRHMLQIDNECMEASLHLAETLGEMGKTEEAVTEYQKLADSLSNAGVIDNSMNWTFLINVYEKIVKLDSVNRGAREWLASAYEEKGDTEKAVEHYTKLADIYKDDKEYASSERIFEKLVELDPDSIEHRIVLAGIKLAPARREEVISMLTQGGEYLLEKGDKKGARRLFEGVLEIDPFDVRVHKGIVSVLVRDHDISQAGQYLTRIGGLCRAAGKTGKAIQAYSTAHELNRDDIKPLRELSEMFFESEETEIPVKTVEQYIALQTSRSNFGEAALTCERLIERFPEHEEYKEKLKDIQSCLSGSTEKGTAASSSTPEAEDHDAGEEDLEETIEALKYVAARSKTNTEAREKLAAMYKQSGNIQEEIRVLDGLAALYKKSGNAAQARKTAERCARLRKEAGISSAKTVKAGGGKKQTKSAKKTRASRKSGDDEPLFKDIPMSIDDFEKGFKG